MLFVSFVGWWYTRGWVAFGNKLLELIKKIAREFSIRLILRTLFSPWKQIISSGGVNTTLGDKIRKVVDNLVSRLVGAGVRFIMLILGLIFTGLLSMLSLLAFIIWPLIPPASVALILLGTGVI